MSAEWPFIKAFPGQTFEDLEASTKRNVDDYRQLLPARKNGLAMEHISLNALLYKVLFGDGLLQR